MILNRTKRGVALVVGGALLCLAPLSASALGISIVNVSSSGGNTDLLQNNDILTIDLRLENASRVDINSLSLGVWGYDNGNDGSSVNDRLRFAGGAVTSSAFNTVLDEGAPLGGLVNIRTAPTEFGRPVPFLDPRRVQLFDGAALTSSDGAGLLDPAVGGGLVGDSPTSAHFRILFRAAAGGLTISSTTLIFGVGAFGNDAVGPAGELLAFNNASLSINVIPEPGTALLLGLGLAGLAAKRRL